MVFFKTSIKTEMSKKTESRLVSKNVKIGKDGQRAIDVFFQSSGKTEMTNQETSHIDEVLRSFVCIKCGAEHVEVPCHQGIMKCQVCNNSKKNIELGDRIYENNAPDYLNSLDSEDERFNYKEFLEYNTKRHQDRLGTLEGELDLGMIPRIRPFEMTVEYPVSREDEEKFMGFEVPYMRANASGIFYTMGKLIPTRPVKGSVPYSINRDKIILAKIAEQIIIPDGSDIIKNTLRRNVRLVNLLQSDEDLKPTYKLVQINSWKKILRENQDALECLDVTFDPEHPPLSPKELGNWTWHFRGMKTLEDRINAFAMIIHKPIDDSMLYEIEIGDKKMIFMEGSPDEVTPASLERQDWLALRSKVGIEAWHDETKRPKFSYQAYMYKIARLVYPRRRMYFNPLTSMFVEILNNEEADLPLPQAVAN